MSKMILLLIVVLSTVLAGLGQPAGPLQDPPAGIIAPDHEAIPPEDEDGHRVTTFMMIVDEDALQAGIRMDKAAYVLGERGTIHFDISAPAYIYVWFVCPTSYRITQLFPSRSDPNNYFHEGAHTIPTPGTRYRLEAGPPVGWKWMQVMALSHPLPGIGPDNHIPFPSPYLSPSDWRHQFINWLDQQLPWDADQAFNFTSYQIVGAPVAQQGTLRVTSNPAGAQVLINGVPRGVTPQWQPFELMLAVGSYSVTVRLAGFQDYNTEVHVVGSGVRSVHADLQSAVAGTGQGNLRIVSNPPGLEVFIGGVHRGRTPVDVSLPAGMNTVQLRSGAHLVWTRAILVWPLVTQTVTVNLSP